MGDFKSEMVWFIADDAVPDPLNASVHDFLNDMVAKDEAAGRQQTEFNSYSNDQYVYLSMLLQCYASPADTPLHDWQDFDFLQLRFHPRSDCHLIAAQLDAWEAAFVADPLPLSTAIQDQLRTFDEPYAPRNLIPLVDGDFLRRLWALNDGQGYHASGDCPAAGLIGSVPFRTNTITAVNQSFGYIRAIRRWMQQADDQALGLVCMIY
jgi:hypothetical protein